MPLLLNAAGDTGRVVGRLRLELLVSPAVVAGLVPPALGA